ncbi:MAG: ABC transporter ATP-binding protein [Clostridia bacterium]|nr:ABC transporter ATP-binding protein [Clostridia bacterium]
MIQCYSLAKTYGSTPALRDISLELPQGKIIGLLGPNGSGKTTLLKILAGVLQPTSGTALIGGIAPGPVTKAHTSYLPDRCTFDRAMRVDECVKMTADFFADFDTLRAQSMLADLEIPMHAKLKTLSKGTLEKVQLILAMSRQADLYLLDEPIGGVDPAARDYILRTVIENHRPGSTVLISTHLIHDVEPILDGFAFVAGGVVIMSGDAGHAREEHGKSLDEIFRDIFRTAGYRAPTNEGGLY